MSNPNQLREHSSYEPKAQQAAQHRTRCVLDSQSAVHFARVLAAALEFNRMALSKIKELRQAAGLSQTELARRVGVTKGAVAQWESGGIKDLKMDHLFKVASALGIDPKTLASGAARQGDLSAEESDLLVQFRRLSVAERAVVVRMMRGLSTKQ